MKAIYDVCAPAKLNLFLHVTGRRADGYHTLESAFMLIDWCDTLHFERRDDGQITREDLQPGHSAARSATGTSAAATPLPADDLTVRAARALKRAAGAGFDPLGVHIGLLKSIPSQAGMGGGSSDAASTLLALNRLWRLNFSLTQLLEIGLTLGADVPFFLHGQNAWVGGIGEQITPLALPEARFLVVKPHEGLETAKVFSHPELPRNTATAIILGFAANPYEFGCNDLQAVAEALCPGVGQSLKWLADQGLQGRMTGSGSAVFAKLPQGAKLPEKALRSSGQRSDGSQVALPEGFLARECRNLPAHPLADWA
jgi:4-diphosphocytidyl-2-C-methyl-D-erythritol kinase